MSEVVQQGSAEEGFDPSQRQSSLQLLFQEFRNHSLGQMIDTEAVIESGMSGARVDQVSRAELLDTSELLKS